MIPGATINLVVKASRFAVAQTSAAPTVVAGWLPTFVGLGSIPIIIHPIDEAVDYLMDNTTRRVLAPDYVFDSNSIVSFFSEPEDPKGAK